MKKLFATLLVLMLAVSGLAMAEEDTSVENILEKGTFILGLGCQGAGAGLRHHRLHLERHVHHART